MEVSPPLKDGHKLKVGIYTPSGKPLYETYYPDESDIVKVDESHFLVDLQHSKTRNLKGITTLRCVIYTQDRTLVTAGNNAMPILWVDEPSTQKLKY